MKYLKYYLLLAALIIIIAEISSKGIKHIDFGMLGMTVGVFAILFVVMSCTGNCGVPNVHRYRSRHSGRNENGR
jgi:hypothetical protein